MSQAFLLQLPLSLPAAAEGCFARPGVVFTFKGNAAGVSLKVQFWSVPKDPARCAGQRLLLVGERGRGPGRSVAVADLLLARAPRALEELVGPGLL